MKILYHHRTASRDGQAVHIDEMIEALRHQGHEVRVVAPRAQDASGGQMGQDLSWVGRLKALLPSAAYELLELAYSVVAYWRLCAAADEFQPDVLYERYNLFMLGGAWLARRRHLPYLVEVNAPLAQEREAFGGLRLRALANWSERQVWSRADRVFVVTRVLGEHVQAAGVPVSRLVVTPNGINPEHFAKAPDVAEAKRRLGWSEALVLGFTGFVRDWHGVDHVIRWLAGPQAPAHARLLVVGDGPVRASLEQLARELGVAARVRFTGVVDRSAVPDLVASFDIALQPAVVPYASPLKLFEYLALGKAVIAPAQPNIEEVLQHERNALLFAAGNTAELAAGLTRLAHDEPLRQRLSEAARRTIMERQLTWARNAQVAVLAAVAVQGELAQASPRSA